MNVRIKKRENPFLQVDKVPINDENLSAASLGVLIYLLSKPDGWKARKNEIKKRFKGKKINTSKNMIDVVFQELRETGYCRIVPVQGKDGKLYGSEYEISEIPDFTDLAKSSLLGENIEARRSSTLEEIPPLSNNELFSNNLTLSLEEKSDLEFFKKIGEIPDQLPEEEKQIRICLLKVDLFFEKYPAMIDVVKESGRILPTDETFNFNEELEKWIRHNSSNLMLLQNPGKFVPKSFIPWVKRFNQFKPKSTPNDKGSSSRKHNSEGVISSETARTAFQELIAEDENEYTN